MDFSTQTDFKDNLKDIYEKLATIQSVLGFILEKTKLIDDNLDERDLNGSVLP